MIFKKLICGQSMMENVKQEVDEIKELLYNNCLNYLGPMSDLAS
jgi:hypothetical protein